MPVEPGVLLFQEGIAAGAGLNLSPTTAHHILPSFIRKLRHGGGESVSDFELYLSRYIRPDFENCLTKKGSS